MALPNTSAAAGGRLETLSYYDHLHTTAANVERVNNVDVISSESGDDDVGICHIGVMMPLGEPSYYFEDAFAVGLAAQHLNAGDGSIVSEVEGLNKRCNVRFTMELQDTAWSESVAVEKLIHTLEREDNGQRRLPCAYIGTASSSVTIPTSIITGIYGFPQLTPLATSTQLDDKDQYKLLGRLIPSDEGTALPAIQYFTQVLGVHHVAVVHDNDQYGSAYARALLKAAREHDNDFSIDFIDMPVQKTPQDFSKAVSFLKSTQFRYFFVIFSNGYDDFEPLMEEAYDQGIAGTGNHNWMFSDYGVPVAGRSYEAGSKLHLAIRGASMLASKGGMPGMPRYDKLAEAWKGLNNEQDINYVVSKHPTQLAGSNYIPDDQYFNSPGWAAPFLYDSMISLGLAACNVSRSSSFFNGTSHFEQILRTSFEGTTGPIELDNTTGTRTPTSAVFVMTNYQEDFSTNEKGTVVFKSAETDVFNEGKWKNIHPFIFNDGTTTPAPGLPLITEDKQYIDKALRAAGLSMSAIILVLSMGFACWIWKKQSTRVVKASQPIFLYIICIGIALMGASIIPLSVDDAIASVEGCNVACMAFPWLVTIGFVTAFAALFSKTWRINKIFFNPTVRRIKVSVKDVMAPLFIFLGVNVLVLALWTGISPLQWTREVTAVDVFDRTMESRGTCTSEMYLPFAIVLGLINMGLVVFAVLQQYRARHISTEFSESQYIALALASLLLVAFVGVPVMFIASSEPRAYYFVLVSIVFVLCLSMLLFMFVPKIVACNVTAKATPVSHSRVPRRYSNAGPSVVGRDSVGSTVEDPNEFGSVVTFHPTKVTELKVERKTWRKEKKELEDRIGELELILKKRKERKPDTKTRDEDSDVEAQDAEDTVTVSTKRSSMS